MALLAGSVDAAGAGSGLAKELFDGFGLGSAPALVRAPFASFCTALATAIVGHLVAHAEIAVTIGTGDAGLQRADVGGSANQPTLAPAAPVPLAGRLS